MPKKRTPFFPFSPALVAQLFPGAVMEYPFSKEIGRKHRADIAWPDKRILVEFEGAVFTKGRHTRGVGYENDCEKYSLASILGWTIVRITSGMWRDGRALKLIEMAFEAYHKRIDA